jgi:trans-2-enoyl-CoA reductase
MHLNAVQTANELYDQGQKPGMLAGRTRTEHDFRNIVEDIFSQQDRQKSLDCIEHYSKVLDLIIGTRGFTGKRLVSARPMFDSLFEVEEETVDPDDLDTAQLDALEESL